jgi:hypothetical protein
VVVNAVIQKDRNVSTSNVAGNNNGNNSKSDYIGNKIPENKFRQADIFFVGEIDNCRELFE